MSKVGGAGVFGPYKHSRKWRVLTRKKAGETGTYTSFDDYASAQAFREDKMGRASKTGVRGLFQDGSGRWAIDLKVKRPDPATGVLRVTRYRETLAEGISADAARKYATDILNGTKAGASDPGTGFVAKLESSLTRAANDDAPTGTTSPAPKHRRADILDALESQRGRSLVRAEVLAALREFFTTGDA